MIDSVTCTKCKDIVVLEPLPQLDLLQSVLTQTAWCKCGSTYLQQTGTSVSYGGPGRPREGER